MKKVLNILLIGTLLLTQTISLKVKQTNSKYNAYNSYLASKGKVDASASNTYDKGLDNLKNKYDSNVNDSQTLYSKLTSENESNLSASKSEHDSQVQGNEDSYNKSLESNEKAYNDGLESLQKSRDNANENSKAARDHTSQSIEDVLSKNQSTYDSLNAAASDNDAKLKAAAESAYNSGVQAYKDTYAKAKSTSDARQQVRQNNLQAISK